MERLAIEGEELEKLQKEQYSRQLPRDTKNDVIRESESISLSLEEEHSSPTLDEDKNTIECEKMPLVLKGELQDPSFVEKNDLAIVEEWSLKEKQVEKKHLELIVENVLVEVEDFKFPIDYLTFGMEEDRQFSFVERPSIATSQMWINAENGEMTLLVGEKKMEFDLHQSKPLTDEERRTFMKFKI